MATDSIIYGQTCIYATLGRATLTLEVFRELDNAEEWLTAEARQQGGT
jgi:hypothetical protein